MSNSCPNLEKCPIYTGILKDKFMTSKAYRQFFCESEKYTTCKRYIIKIATGICPPNLLPNTVLSVEEILKEYKLTLLPNN